MLDAGTGHRLASRTGCGKLPSGDAGRTRAQSCSPRVSSRNSHPGTLSVRAPVHGHVSPSERLWTLTGDE